jgi:hypothetical protein
MSRPADELPSRLSWVGPVRPGQPLELRWILAHPMESGSRVDNAGKRIARHLVERVVVRLDDQVLLELEPGAGMAANPYLAFWVDVPAQGGTVSVEWRDDAGRSGRIAQRLAPAS